jgi:RND family efflux transporter MFP subunit
MPSLLRCTQFLLPLLLALDLLTSSSGSEAAAFVAKEDAPPVAVTVATASEQTLPALAEVVGTIQAAERAAIAAKVTGVITRMPVVLGSTVQTGDLLVAISAEEIAARFNQAEAQLAQARRNLDREQHLLQKNATTAETVKSMQDLHAIAQAGYREAKAMLGYTTITAPFDGVVTQKMATSGDLAMPGTILLQLENSRKLQVRTAVPESIVLRLHTGDDLTVMVETAEVTTRGTIAEIAPAADPRSRTAMVILDLPADPDLRTGQFARVRIPGNNSKTLVIPTTAIVPAGQMDRVFVVEGDHARLRLVRTGMDLHGLTEILSGLNPGEVVVTTNNRRLVNGQRLRIEP